MTIVRALFAAALLLVQPALAQLTIEITQGADDPTAIAIVPFEWRGRGRLDEDIPAIVSADLQRVGQFEPVAQKDMLSLPTRYSEVVFRDWRAIGAEYVVVGRIQQASPDAPFVLEYEVADVFRQQQVMSRKLSGSRTQLRDLAHKLSDEIYEKLTGIKGAFSTRILYVAANQLGAGRFKYQLVMADADGARAKILLDSAEPILSPSWAPGGGEIAYVSFENGGRPAIYRHQLRSGLRERMVAYPGINGAPAWSPDGNQLAMVLSKGGNPDIYVMDMGTRRLKAIAPHYAIDTEPSWMPDGKSLLFTSDRGGAPQIYRAELDSGKVERLTFEGDYNARATFLPERNAIIMVHRRGGERAFHVAIQSLDTGQVRILSQSSLDESPSVAPNGAMLMYATKHNGRGILAVVSVDGSVRFRLPSSASDVREPSWSPYLH